jgi:hypothetical protein
MSERLVQSRKQAVASARGESLADAVLQLLAEFSGWRNSEAREALVSALNDAQASISAEVRAKVEAELAAKASA